MGLEPSHQNTLLRGIRRCGGEKGECVVGTSDVTLRSVGIQQAAHEASREAHVCHCSLQAMVLVVHGHPADQSRFHQALYLLTSNPVAPAKASLISASLAPLVSRIISTPLTWAAGGPFFK